jgi:acetyl-CoA carboxylase carboxyl transferase subunit beta
MSKQGPRWFEKGAEFVGVVRLAAANGQPEATPDLWTRCPGCTEMLYNDALADNLMVCHLCGMHMKIDAWARIMALCDEGTIQENDEDLAPIDALGFVDSKPYDQRITASQKKTGRNDAMRAVSASIDGIEVELGCFDFRFMGGSMGSVVGEVITRIYERAAERRVPAIIISASGGARMQEGVLSLMQMAKSCAALAKLQEVGMPYVSVLTHPTTGGVAASFAMLGDVILAEPGALIGFAGPRVIKETIGEELPAGFQTSEYLFEHGMVDRIVPRGELRGMLSRVIRLMLGAQPATPPEPENAGEGVEHPFTKPADPT